MRVDFDKWKNRGCKRSPWSPVALGGITGLVLLLGAGFSRMQAGTPAEVDDA
jgi:hypothetical protein